MSAPPDYYSEDQEKALRSVEDEAAYVEAAPGRVIVSRFGILGPLLSRLFASGVECISLLMWWFVNAVLTTITVRVLGQSIFTLSFGNAVATIVCFGALGGVATVSIATLGPVTGLRTMIITRFSSGYFGTIYSVLNILIQLGYSATVVILGGQTLANINPGTFPLVVGITSLSFDVCYLIPCFVGYDMVHVYECYAWIVTNMTTFFIVIVAEEHFIFRRKTGRWGCA